MVLQSDPRNGVEGLPQRFDHLRAEHAELLYSDKSVERRGDRHTACERVEPGQIANRDDQRALEVEQLSRLVTQPSGKSSLERRQLQVRDRPCQPRNEIWMTLCGLKDRNERRDDLKASDDMPNRR